jgi:hypothetical protein
LHRSLSFTVSHSGLALQVFKHHRTALWLKTSGEIF